MTLRLYNTVTKRKEPFAPIDAGAVRMYVCGPTVYDLAHIGNGRAIIAFDLLFRVLRHIYGADQVVYARNITDVEDKINARAVEEGISIGDLTERTIAQFHTDVAALGCLPPSIEPRATEHIGEMIAMIEVLIGRGFAYEAEGHVLFQVASDPSYGALARRSLDEMRAGARVEVAPYKRDAMDFVLWKPSGGDAPGWESPWGYGRPGWHIECSAMAAKHLGRTFDIHGGGIDLVFPHHENELAQSTCAHGTGVMANVWMHNGHLQADGAKMSKSLGNFITINRLVREWPGEVIVLAMLSTHYRQPMNWTATLLADAKHALDQWYAVTADVSPGSPSPAFLEALYDDLNSPLAITELHRMRHDAVGGDRDAGAALKGSAKLLGLLAKPLQEWKAWRPRDFRVDEDMVKQRIGARLTARNAKNWREADRIRDELAGMGIVLKDTKNPSTGEIETTWGIAT